MSGTGFHHSYVPRHARAQSGMIRLRRRSRPFAVAGALGVMVALGIPVSATHAAQAPVGAGFTVTAGDLSFILRQVNIAERHAATQTPAKPCATLVNQPGDGIPDDEQIPDV